MEAPQDARTLAIDVGGTRLKAAVLDARGVAVAGPVRTDTPHPSPPLAVVAALQGLASQLGQFDRISIGFPGVVRHGAVRTAPNLGTELWRGFPLAATLSAQLERPARMLNDATVQGLGAIGGQGVECVITLGTGFGFALFQDGRPGPHLEMSQHPIRKDAIYDDYLGTAAFRAVGKRRWNRRVARALRILSAVVIYDHLFIGGGNAKFIEFALPDGTTVVDNQAGITGGVRLWDGLLDPVFTQGAPALSQPDSVARIASA
jgi:polyphosphate glucokinase